MGVADAWAKVKGFFETDTRSETWTGVEPCHATIIEKGGERRVRTEEIHAGDIVRVLRGEYVPVDGVIISGSSFLNPANTNARDARRLKVGDVVTRGSRNRYAEILIRATRMGREQVESQNLMLRAQLNILNHMRVSM